MVSIAQKLTILVVPYQSDEYQAALQLRTEVLRKPLGLEFTESELKQDRKDYHVVAKIEETVIGCLLLSAQDSSVVRMKQVAVLPEYHGQGVGKAMVEDSEAFAKQQGFSLIFCNARDTAVSFYEQLGYHKVGEPFTAVGIEHWRLEKSLT